MARTAVVNNLANLIVTALTAATITVSGLALFNDRVWIKSNSTQNIIQVGNLNDSARFFEVSATGTKVTGDFTVTGTCTGCGGASSQTLNQAYNAATGSPEISITPSVGPLTIANIIGAGSNNIFELQDRVDSAGNFSKRVFMTSNATSTFDYTGNTTQDGLTITGGTAATTGNTLAITAGGSSSTTGSALKITGSSAGTSTVNAVGHALDVSMAGNITVANNGAMVMFKGTGITTGNVFTMTTGDSQTSGQGMLVTGRGFLSGTGRLFKVDKFAAAARTNANAAIMSEFTMSDTYTGGGNLAVTGNVLNVTRQNTTNNAGATPTVSGAVMTISDNGTQTLGTLTHTAPVLSITQNYTASTGEALTISNLATSGWGARFTSPNSVLRLNSSLNRSAIVSNLFQIDDLQGSLMTVSATSTAFKGSTGSVSANAVTCNGTVCRITDTTDINAATTRAAITLTNSAISATSNVHVGLCGTQDSGAMIVGAAVPGAGSATLTISNAGPSNQTTTLDLCVTVFGSLP